MLARFLAVALVGTALATPAIAATDDEGRTVHTVYPGQTIAKIAKRYRVSVDDLLHANRLRRGARIQPGQKLVIPDGTGDRAEPSPRHLGNHWQDYSDPPRKKGFVVLQSPTKHWQGFVLTRRGKVLPHAHEAIEKMFASWRTGVEHEIDPRLIQLVVRVSDTFGGRPIRVVSGYRERSFAVESKHKVGRAFDFSIPGVPNAVLRDYLRTLPNVGIGYYPNSTHVHLDVREEAAYWVDEAGPGEPPKYARRGKVESPSEDTTGPGEQGPAPETEQDEQHHAEIRVE